MKEPDDRLLTVTARWDDLDNAVSAISAAHAEFCVGKCDCMEVMDRLDALLETAVDSTGADE